MVRQGLMRTGSVNGVVNRRHAQLDPGDLLAIFSDGITEAARGEEEFGEARFIDELRSGGGRSETDLVTAILASVQQFSAGNQSDDLTLVIARGLPATATPRATA